MVWARLRGQLDALKELFSELLNGCEIQESAGTDYAYRLFVEKSVWTQALGGTDYGNRLRQR